MNAKPLVLVAAGLAAALLRPPTVVHAPAPPVGPQIPPAGDPPQDGDQEDDETEQLPGLLGLNAARQRQLMEVLPGNWRLTDFVHSTNDLGVIGVFGYLSIEKGGYLNFLVHTRDPNAPLFEDDLRVQAGVHHWRLTDGGFLQTSSILAHTNFSGELQIEQVMTPREYGITLLGEKTMILRRPDDSQLVFEKLGTAAFPAEAARRIEAIRDGSALLEGF